MPAGPAIDNIDRASTAPIHRLIEFPPNFERPLIPAAPKPVDS
jgi:hypothetical protein